MKSKMADVWRPAMGINIKELEPGLFLFQFYHKEDMNWVLKGGPWSIDNAMLVMAEVPTGEEPLSVPLWHVNMWMQIFELPSGFISGGFSCDKVVKSMIIGSSKMQELQNHGDNPDPLKLGANNLEVKGDNSNLNIEDGPDNDEMIGLQITERKRMRGGPDNYDIMDTPGGLAGASDSIAVNKNNDGVLSDLDYTSSNNFQLAKLAQQASRTL
ncbi:hypothetical protein DCAR_0101580 [Daucus carota subsp. sativus]|uniref:DUF4283 domain-containing protein n=1 Tax=Daucus carota subsp. sativus TaxID=79200 RepID=A0AAF0W3Q0_DAUCS|nr:hypothetical protein DCAR_0101580 [Daucus carota subsp. sativus]